MIPVPEPRVHARAVAVSVTSPWSLVALDDELGAEPLPPGVPDREHVLGPAAEEAVVADGSAEGALGELDVVRVAGADRAVADVAAADVLDQSVPEQL
jgi:hypothetical protein